MLIGENRVLREDGLVFVVLVFLGLLPILNAVFDTISVVVTRAFLRRYLATGRGWFWMTVVDLLVAVGLTVLLYWSVMHLFEVLQWLGWRIDAKGMRDQFRADPTNPQVSWILAMALTNIIPTLLHLSLAVAGLWSGWLLRDEGFAEAMRTLQVKPTSLIVVPGYQPPIDPTALPTLSKPLSSSQANKLVNWVYFDFWLAALLVPAMALALWRVWRELVTVMAGWLG